MKILFLFRMYVRVQKWSGLVFVVLFWLGITYFSSTRACLLPPRCCLYSIVLIHPTFFTAYHSTTVKMSSEHSETNISMSDSDTRVLMQLMAPDGYYTYLQIPKPRSDKDEIDTALLKKNYRKLSLKHHPDRATGHVETFRALNRAHVVLLHSKLRQQYDLLGIDLEEDHHDDHDGNQESHKQDDQDQQGDENNNGAAAPETLVSAFASAALAGVLQATVRTGMYITTHLYYIYIVYDLLIIPSFCFSFVVVMMGLTAVLLTRYLLLIVPAGLFLVFTAFRIQKLPGSTGWDACHPLVLGLGLVLMHYGRTLPEQTWSFFFWIGAYINTVYCSIYVYMIVMEYTRLTLYHDIDYYHDSCRRSTRGNHVYLFHSTTTRDTHHVWCHCRVHVYTDSMVKRQCLEIYNLDSLASHFGPGTGTGLSHFGNVY